MEWKNWKYAKRWAWRITIKKLQATIKRAFNKIPYYNKRYTEAKVYPEDINTLKDIEKLPF